MVAGASASSEGAWDPLHLLIQDDELLWSSSCSRGCPCPPPPPPSPTAQRKRSLFVRVPLAIKQANALELVL